jgi:hypothetical protein
MNRSRFIRSLAVLAAGAMLAGLGAVAPADARRRRPAPFVRDVGAITSGTYADSEYGVLNVTATGPVFDFAAGDEVAGTPTYVGEACAALPAGDGIALVARGTCTFQEKHDFAVAAGFDSLVIFNSQLPAGATCMDLVNPLINPRTVPVFFMTRMPGLRLLGVVGVTPENACTFANPAPGTTAASTSIGRITDPARTVVCRAQINGRVRLTGDLDCEEQGLRATGTGTSLDLAGYTLKGHLKRYIGVHINAPRGSVRRGTITGFGTGVFYGADGNRRARNEISGITATANGTGLSLAGDYIDVVGNRSFTNTVDGIYVGFLNAANPTSDRVTISGNALVDNGVDGVFVQSAKATLLKVVGNHAHSNNGMGLNLTGATSVSVTGNRAYTNGGQGIVALDQLSTTGSGNDAIGNTEPQCVPARLCD